MLPWALVGLVTVAGLVGALVGATNQPSASAQLSLSAIDAATRAAGTARFTYSAITTSTNPLLRSTSVNGHRELPTGGHRNSPGMDTTIPQGRPRKVPADGHGFSPRTATGTPRGQPDR